jgi:hypothetical protein
MTVLKMVAKREGPHVKTTFFMGPENQTLANIGTLTQAMGEWQLFGVLILLGRDAVNKNYPRLLVITEDDEEVAASFDSES